MTNTPKIALITGATAGIGKASAWVFAQQGWSLILTARRQQLLEQIAQEIAQTCGVQTLPLCFDVRSRTETENALQNLPEQWQNIDLLLNNAGLAQGLNDFQEGNFDDWEAMIDTNIKGFLYVARLIAPLMAARNTGHIINVGSVAGKEAYAKGHVYCATKFAVDALTKAMRIDLLKHKVKVSSVSPGAVETDFSIVRYKGDTERAAQVYKGYTPLTAEDIADAVWYIASRPPHVVIQDVVLTPLAQASATYWAKDND